MKQKSFSSSKKVYNVLKLVGGAAMLAFVICISFGFNPFTSLGLGFAAAKIIGFVHMAVVVPASVTKAAPKATGVNNENAKVVGSGLSAPQIDHVFEDPKAHMQVNISMLPQKFTVTVAGTPAANSTNTLIYLFNPSVFAPVTAATGQDTDNIAYTWSDKNQGLTIERILYTARFAIGAILYGFSVSLTINGAGDVQGLNTLQPTIGDWDAYGNFIVQENFVTSSNETRKDQFLYLHVTRCAHNMGGTKQIRFTLPMNGTTSADTAAWVFYLTPNFEL